MRKTLIGVLVGIIGALVGIVGSMQTIDWLRLTGAVLMLLGLLLFGPALIRYHGGRQLRTARL